MSGRKCFVPNCNYKEKRTVFAVTKKRLNAWSYAISRKDRILSTNDVVCEKHFNPECILRVWKAPNSDITIPLKRCKLSKDAIPTIFPSCIQKNVIKRKPPTIKYVDNSKSAKTHIKQISNYENSISAVEYSHETTTACNRDANDDSDGMNLRNGKCFVPNCTTGYKSNKEKFSLFSTPINLDLRNAWEQNIKRMDRQLQRKDKVCEKHFTEDNIIGYLEIQDVKHPYKRPKLKPGAIPTIFPKCPTQLTRNMKKISGHNSIKTEVVEEGDGIHVNLPYKAFVLDSILNVTKTQGINKLIFQSITQENLEPLNWDYHLIENVDENRKSVVLTQLKLLHSEPVIYKSLVIKDDLSWSMYYLKHKVQESVVSSLSHIKDLLRSMEKQNICKGGPETSCYSPKSRNLTTASVDENFFSWRHKQCKIICGTELQCDNCLNLFNLFNRKKDAMKSVKKSIVPKINSSNLLNKL